MRTTRIRHPWLLLLALLCAGLVTWFLWSPQRSDTHPVQLAEWKRIAPDGAITKGSIWRNPEGREISGDPESQSGLVIKRYPGEACQYTYAIGERPVFLLSFGMPGVLYGATYLDDANGEVTWSARYLDAEAATPNARAAKTRVVHIEKAQPTQDGAKASTRISYYPDTQKVLIQELRNGTPWNGLFSTPTIPHWRVETFKNGVATELGKDLSDADLAQLEHRYWLQSDRDYDAEVKNTIQLHIRQIQSALKTSQPFTTDCPID
jgi:hypothetical protein